MLGNVFILGDSYSTFRGHIPEGYSAYYTPEGPFYLKADETLTRCDNDVSKVEETWWYTLIEENGKLIRNCSWSGTTVCNTGKDGMDVSDRSFIGRFEKLIEEGFFRENHIDTVFLFGGTNDSWVNSPLGEPMESGWKREDLYNALPGFAYLEDLIVKTIPDAKVYCILNIENLKDEIIDFYKKFSEKKGITVIELRSIEKLSGHPTVRGMARILDVVREHLR